MRGSFWMLAPVLAFSLACSKHGTENTTEIAVVVLSDLTVPSEMNNIHIDIKGPSKTRFTVFPLTAGNEAGKTRLPLQLSLVPADNRALEFDITATGYLDDTAVVSQTASLAFLPGQRRLLTLHLDRQCIPVRCDPGNTCAFGTCKTATVAPGTLPIFDPSEPLPTLDAGVGPDSGWLGDASLEPDSTIDVTAEVPRSFDGPSDRSLDIPPDASGSSLLDSGSLDNAGQGRDGVGDVTAEVPLDGSFDLTVGILPDTGVDGSSLDSANSGAVEVAAEAPPSPDGAADIPVGPIDSSADLGSGGNAGAGGGGGGTGGSTASTGGTGGATTAAGGTAGATTAAGGTAGATTAAGGTAGATTATGGTGGVATGGSAGGASGGAGGASVADAAVEAGTPDGGQYTLTLSFAGAGAGTVVIQPGNTTCTAPTTCTAAFDGGAQVTLTAKPTNGGATVSSVLSGWAGACAANGPYRFCSLTVSGATSTTARFDTLPANLVFVTSGAFPGNLGSALAYQSQCNSLATAAGINNATNDAYIAWLAATNYAPLTLLGSTRGWVRADLLPWIDDMAATISSGDVFYPSAYDENGQRVYASTLSGMDGATGIWMNCNDWTDSSLGTSTGHTHAGGKGWTNHNVGWSLCSNAFRVLCVMKGGNAPVAPTPVAGKKIYLTKSGWLPGGGISAADAKCFADAPTSVTAVKAILVASTRAFTDALGAATVYVRPDGVKVGTGAEIVQALTTYDVPATIESAVTQDGDGSPTGPAREVWKGIAVQGSSDRDSCRDWTSMASTDTGTVAGVAMSWTPCVGNCAGRPCAGFAFQIGLQCAEQ